MKTKAEPTHTPGTKAFQIEAFRAFIQVLKTGQTKEEFERDCYFAGLAAKAEMVCENIKNDLPWETGVMLSLVDAEAALEAERKLVREQADEVSELKRKISTLRALARQKLEEDRVKWLDEQASLARSMEDSKEELAKIEWLLND